MFLLQRCYKDHVVYCIGETGSLNQRGLDVRELPHRHVIVYTREVDLGTQRDTNTDGLKDTQRRNHRMSVRL